MNMLFVSRSAEEKIIKFREKIIFDMLADLLKNHKIEKENKFVLFVSPLPTLATPPQKTQPYF
jgi:hypothetical protein